MVTGAVGLPVEASADNVSGGCVESVGWAVEAVEVDAASTATDGVPGSQAATRISAAPATVAIARLRIAG
jgi:hypothetical protein